MINEPPKNLVATSPKGTYLYYCDKDSFALIILGKVSKHNLEIHKPRSNLASSSADRRQATEREDS
jgi:hypothetical protein